MSKIKRIALVSLSLLLITLPAQFAFFPVKQSNVIHVVDPHDLPKVSALLLMEKTSGSSTLVRSGPDGSDFLTNAHVCKGAKKGGIVILDGKTYEMAAIKPSQHVDLCLVHVKEDLKRGIELADKSPKIGDEIMTGGYPLTLPIVIQKGFTSRILNIGTRAAPEPAMLTSILVQHGHSGTGVFDKEGKLVGVIQAYRPDKKSDTIGFGLAVPLRSTRIFMEKESPSMKWIAVPHVPRS